MVPDFLGPFETISTFWCHIRQNDGKQFCIWNWEGRAYAQTPPCLVQIDMKEEKKTNHVKIPFSPRFLFYYIYHLFVHWVQRKIRNQLLINRQKIYEVHSFFVVEWPISKTVSHGSQVFDCPSWAIILDSATVSQALFGERDTFRDSRTWKKVIQWYSNFLTADRQVSTKYGLVVSLSWLNIC